MSSVPTGTMSSLGSLETHIPTVVALNDWAPTILRLMGWKVSPYYTVRLAMRTQTLLRADALTANSPTIAHRAARTHGSVTRAGKDRWPTAARALLQTGQALLEEPLAPLRHDLSSGIEPSGDLVDGPRSGHQRDLGPHHIAIRQRISTGGASDSRRWSALNVSSTGSSSASFPSWRGALTIPAAPIRDHSYVLVFMVGCT
jgi:hypothetical protein